MGDDTLTAVDNSAAESNLVLETDAGPRTPCCADSRVLVDTGMGFAVGVVAVGKE